MKTPIALKAQQLLLARLHKIRKGDLYNTDAGLYVELGPLAVSVERPYSIFVQFSAETPRAGTGSGGSTGSFKIDREVTITGVIGVDPGCDRGEALEYMLADIKQATFLYEDQRLDPKHLGPLTYQSSRILPRADGNQYESVEVTASFAYLEAYGDPYAVR